MHWQLLDCCCKCNDDIRAMTGILGVDFHLTLLRYFRGLWYIFFFVDSIGTIVLPPSPDADRSIARSTTQLAWHQDADSSKDFLYANSVVQSLNSASSAAHIYGVGIKAIPSIWFQIRNNTSSFDWFLLHWFAVHITPGFLPKSLHTLNLSRNKISTIEGLRELTRLRVLDLSFFSAWTDPVLLDWIC